MTPMHGRALHEFRVMLLKTVSDLLECFEDFGGQLPDSCRPDVLRINRAKEMLLIGDAKNTESPTSSATLARLFGYLRWVKAHVRRGGMALFVLCYGRNTGPTSWQDSVRALASELELACSFVSCCHMSRDDHLLCCVFSPNVFGTY